MADYTGTPIPSDQAWRIFSAWKSSRREIGAIFYGCSGTSILTMGFVEPTCNGALLVKNDTARASFNLTLANFTYGPFPTWPKWPYPPIVEMTAVRARMENGDWLILVDGLRPESLPSRALPAKRGG
jgi:hypothetical protein